MIFEFDQNRRVGWYNSHELNIQTKQTFIFLATVQDQSMNTVSVKPAILSKFMKSFLYFTSPDSLFYIAAPLYTCRGFHFVIATRFLRSFNFASILALKKNNYKIIFAFTGSESTVPNTI